MIYAVALVSAVIIGLLGVFLGIGYFETPALLSQRRFTTLISTLILVAAFDIGGMWAYWGTVSPITAMQLTKARALPKILVFTLRAKTDLPAQLTEHIWIENFQAHDNTLVYQLTVDAADSQTFNTLANEYANNLHENGCQVEYYYDIVKNGVKIEFDFHSPSNWNAPAFFLTPQLCGIN